MRQRIMSVATIIHDDISLKKFVIPGLTRNPVFSWIPAGVYPDGNRGRNDRALMRLLKRFRTDRMVRDLPSNRLFVQEFKDGLVTHLVGLE